MFGCCTPVLCQTGRLTGSVLDAETRLPLELATVSIFAQDSSLVTYQLSDKSGKFTIEKLPLKRKLLVGVTYTGYLAHHSSVQLESGRADTLAVLLTLNPGDTNAVVITATVPIRMNGDTLEINPAAFKLKPDAVVEELLNQVSGVVIWSDGTITVNGKKVQNLLVDGKPFLGSTDSRVATQNLPKTAIDKIQLYQEYDRANIGKQNQPQDSLLTMNIKLKEASKRGYFGKAGAGYGTSGRFESDLSFQLYNKSSSAGIGGGINNINKGIGNLQEMFQNNTYRNYNPNLYSVGRFGAQGINKNYSIGGVFTHSFIETANSRQANRIAINYNASGTDAYLTDVSLQNRTTRDVQQFIRDEGVQKARNDRQDLGINYVKTNSYNDNLSVNGSVNTANDRGRSSRYTEVRESAGGLQSTNRVTSLQNRRSDNESLNVNFAQSDRDDPLTNFNLQFNARRGNNASVRDVVSLFQSLTDPGKNTFYNRRYATNNESVNIGGVADYAGFKRMLLRRYSLFGITLSLSQWLNYSRSSDNTSVSDYDSASRQYKTNGSLSNYNRRQIFEYSPALVFSKGFFKWSDKYYRNINVQLRLLEDIKTDQNLSSFAKRNLDRSFRFFRYEGNLGFQRQQREKYQYYLSLGYTKNFQYPTIDQLYTIVDDINAYDIRIGNPGLRNTVLHRFNFNGNFNTQNPKAAYSFNGNVGGGYNRSLHPVTDSVINDPSGKRISYFINADGSSSLNFNYNLNVSRRLKKSNLQLMYSGSVTANETPNFTDGVYNISKTSNVSNQVTLQFSLRSILVTNISKTVQSFRTRQTAAGLRPFESTNNATKFGVVLNYPANFTLSSTVDHIGNSNLVRPIVLWNAFATYRFMKQQGELKLSAMDLLKQYQNVTNSVNAYGTTTRITNGLQQFFLLTFSYYPRKFGKTEIKKQSSQNTAY